ncbi:MAG: DMT family transporter [Gammaproteobacteria bacterium]|nr:DMT family transporter [Gammaproteobacteria bacterium]
MPTPSISHRQYDQSPLIGFSAMMLSVVLFSMMDATVKWLGGTYPTQQIMFFRCLIALIPLLVIIRMRGGVSILRTAQVRMHLLRSLLGITAMGLAFYAFSLMRLADAISILHMTPIFITAMSIFILREKVGLHRWSAVICGFAGMLLVVKPGQGMIDNGSLYMLLAAFLISCTTIIIRHLSIRDDPVCITFYFTLTGVLISTIGLVSLGWRIPSLFDLLLLIAIGLLGGIAQYMMTLSYRHAEIGMVAPLKYLTILFGGGFGYLLWSEIPDLQSLIGIAIIASAGLYTMHRELIHARKKTI